MSRVDWTEYTQNRELSWLKFNERVLEEASDPSVPLFERLKFISIFTSNLDEFFMVRVGSLYDISNYDPKYRDSRSNMTAKEQLEAIYPAVSPLYFKKIKVYNEIKKSLTSYGIYPLGYGDLEKNEVKYIKEYFKNYIKPILSPQIVDALHPFPHISSKDLYIVTLLQYKDEVKFGILPVPKSLPPVIFLPGNDIRFIRTENIIIHLVQKAFNHFEVLEKNCICITRNADIQPDQYDYDGEIDFREMMKDLLNKRKRLAVVRLEANYSMSDTLRDELCSRFDIEENQIYITSGALKMKYVFDLLGKCTPIQKKQLFYKPFQPIPALDFDEDKNYISQIKKSDKLLYYPFESMNGFLQVLKEAASNPSVISIKITIYRLASKSKLVDYLCRAAENGKEVTVVMELRARFDEKNNIDWSEYFEEAGCTVIYGFDLYKIHSKVCLITSKEKNGVSYITHIGTGNYNESTAKLYTDLSLLTHHQGIGNDAVEFFKNLSIGNLGDNYEHLLVAPLKLKDQLLTMIGEEIIKGKEGFILIKMNSLTDLDIIKKLSEASIAGVKVRLIIRGICCILPGIPGKTENIEVISIVGRFLEHPRIYSFGKNSNQKLYISSADLMTRNTEKRIEVATPIYDLKLKERINEILEMQWNDNIKARILCIDGQYEKRSIQEPLIDSQEEYIEIYKEANYKKPKKTQSVSIFAKIKKLFTKK